MDDHEEGICRIQIARDRKGLDRSQGVAGEYVEERLAMSGMIRVDAVHKEAAVAEKVRRGLEEGRK